MVIDGNDFHPRYSVVTLVDRAVPLSLVANCDFFYENEQTLL